MRPVSPRHHKLFDLIVVGLLLCPSMLPLVAFHTPTSAARSAPSTQHGQHLHIHQRDIPWHKLSESKNGEISKKTTEETLDTSKLEETMPKEEEEEKSMMNQPNLPDSKAKSFHQLNQAGQVVLFMAASFFLSGLALAKTVIISDTSAYMNKNKRTSTSKPKAFKNNSEPKENEPKKPKFADKPPPAAARKENHTTSRHLMGAVLCTIVVVCMIIVLWVYVNLNKKKDTDDGKSESESNSATAAVSSTRMDTSSSAAGAKK